MKEELYENQTIVLFQRNPKKQAKSQSFQIGSLSRKHPFSRAALAVFQLILRTQVGPLLGGVLPSVSPA